MKAIARLCWTYGTALPIQRWLGVLVLATVALGLVAFALSGHPLYLLALVVTAMYVLATTFVTGFLCRALSVTRTHRFLPHFRPRMVAAFLLVVVAVSSPELAVLVLQPGVNHWPALLLLLVVNLSVLMMFSPGKGIGCALLFVIYVAAGHPFGDTAPLDLLGPSPTVAAVAVWAGAWTAFAIWYLRARNFSPLQWPPRLLAGGKLDLGLPADRTGEFSRSSALATSLSAHYPLRAQHLLLRIVFMVAVVAAASITLRRFGTASPVAFGYVGLALLPPICALGPVANQLARRTRPLWLASGLSRRALFATMERAVWRSKVPWSFAAFACILAAAALAYELPVGLLARLFAVWAGGTALAVYFGLVMRGALTAELCAALALIPSLGVGAWAALGEPPHYDWILGVVALQLAGAVALRALAIARWERLDWLTFRPLRGFSQSLRPRG